MTTDAEILFEQRGSLGLVTLNRPKALNSLTADMCALLLDQLTVWRADNTIACVAVVGAGEKAFCAGGDVVRVVKSFQEGGDDHTRFFATEYRMNVAIDEFPKPFVSFVDGITMGGGVGVSMPGDFWVASEKTLFAMPETGLGLFPDVGGGWFLPRLDGGLGMYLALTGARAKAGDLYHMGIASHVVESADVPKLIEALSTLDGPDSDAVAAILDVAHSNPDVGPIMGDKVQIDAYFTDESLDIILAKLGSGNDWAKAIYTDLLAKSPTSLKITFEQLKRGAEVATFRQNMAMEYRMVQRCMAGHDFPEGVRALLIDKDRQTKWLPAILDGVSDSDVEAYFAPLESELSFD